MQTGARDPDKLKQRLLDFARDFAFFRLIGLEVCDLAPKWSKCQLQSRDDLQNPSGVVHGGVIATLIDTAIAQALLMTEEYQVVRDSRGGLVTVDLHVKYLRPASHGRLLCEAKIVHLGKRVMHAQAVVRNDQDKDIALGDATLMLVAGNG
jgi:uncharacterized protein (TIGR00369 family)